jgi:hypothetical protein
VAHGSASTVRSRSTAARAFREIKNAFTGSPRNPSSILSPIPGAFFFPPEHASERRPAATERAAPRRAPSPARASTARWARRRRAASPWCPDLARASGTAVARAASVRARSKRSRGLVGVPASRAHRQQTAQEVSPLSRRPNSSVARVRVSVFLI